MAPLLVQTAFETKDPGWFKSAFSVTGGYVLASLDKRMASTDLAVVLNADPAGSRTSTRSSGRVEDGKNWCETKVNPARDRTKSTMVVPTTVLRCSTHQVMPRRRRR